MSKFFELQSGDVFLAFDLPENAPKSEDLTFLEIQLMIIAAIEEFYKQRKTKIWPGWGLIGELYINKKKAGLIPMIPYLADAGAQRDVNFLEKCLTKADMGMQVIYQLVLDNYNKNAANLFA